jgi:polar amino acid transport system substrate-binding protein
VEYPPYVYIEEGEVSGLATDLVRQVFAQMNKEVIIEVLPWARALKLMQEGGADGIYPLFKKAGREGYLAYGAMPLFIERVHLYSRLDSPIIFNGNFNKLVGRSLAVTRAFSYGERFDRQVHELFENLTVVNDEVAKFMLLERGRVDLVVSNQASADYYIEKLGLIEKVKSLGVEVDRKPSFIAFSKKSSKVDLLKEFDRLLAITRAEPGL